MSFALVDQQGLNLVNQPDMSEKTSTGDRIVPPDGQQEWAAAQVRGNDERDCGEKNHLAQASLKSDSPYEADERGDSRPFGALVSSIPMKSEARHSELVTSSSKTTPLTDDSVEPPAATATTSGSHGAAPGVYHVGATGRSTSSPDLTDEEDDTLPPPPIPSQPDDSQGPLQQWPLENQHPARVPVGAESSSMDLAPLILEAVVVAEAPDQVSTTRNSAIKPVLVEGRPETPNRERTWLTLLGLVTLGVAVGISVGITQNQSKGSVSQSTTEVTPTAPPSLAPTTVAILEELLTSLPDPTRAVIEADPSSPQAKAFAWLSRPQHPRYESREMWRYMQRFALATLYYSTKGDLWRKNAGWLNETVNECDWCVW
jgi:hypothetical protein